MGQSTIRISVLYWFALFMKDSIFIGVIQQDNQESLHIVLCFLEGGMTLDMPFNEGEMFYYELHITFTLREDMK